MRTRGLFWLGCLLVLAAAWWLRVADFANIPPGIYYDDGRLLQRAWRLTEGYGLALYFQDIAEPFDQIVRAAFYTASGGVDWHMARLFTAWLNLLGVAATIALGRAFFSGNQHRDALALFAGLVLATLPPAVMIGRHLYRANWLPLTIALALLFLVRAWQRPTRLNFALAGLFTGFTMIFYTGGILFPPVILLILGSMWLMCRLSWPRPAHWLALGLGFGGALIPWLVLYLRVPGWLSRVRDLSAGESPLSDVSLLLPHLWTTLTSIFLPSALHDMRYAPYTTGFLNPALLFLFAIGVGAALWRWSTPWRLAPLLVFVAMIWTNVLSSEPYQPVRVVGIFVPLALLTAMGAAVLWKVGSRARFGAVMLLIAAFTPLYSAYHIAYHYNQQPRITDPHVPDSLALKYRMGYGDLLAQIITSQTPVYLPLEHLNTDLAVAVLRPDAFPTVRPYQQGEALPVGRVILPIDSISYGFFRYEQIPVQYGLLLPERGEIVILPPLGAAVATALYEEVRASGSEIVNADGWVLAQETTIAHDSNPFARVQIIAGEVLATYAGNLDLVGVDLPAEVAPGTTIPVTLYWRLSEGSAPDYFSRLQLWDYSGSNQGFERRSPLVNEPDFPLNILYNIYPTVMWQPGEIVPDTRYLPLNTDSPPGGYRLALAVYEYPGLVPLPPQSAAVQAEWALLGRTVVTRESYVQESEPAAPALATLDTFAELVSYSVTPEVGALAPGSTLTVRIDWRVIRPTHDSFIHFVHLLDASGALVAQQDVLPFGGTFPTWAWPLGGVVSPQFSLTVPQESEAPFTLRAGMYRYPSLENLPVMQDGEVRSFILLE